MGRPKCSPKSSVYRGVYWVPARRKRAGGKPGYWVARIFHEGRSRRLGYFGTQEDAALAYDAAAVALKGWRAQTNGPLFLPPRPPRNELDERAVLAALAAGAALRGDLAARSGVPLPRVVRAVTRLGRRGLVRRDGYGVALRL